MADAIRKDQQNQNRSLELDSAQDKDASKTKTSISATQNIPTNTRSVGRKHKTESPILQVRDVDKLNRIYPI